MPAWTDFISIYIVGIIEALTEYHFFVTFLHKKAPAIHYLLFAAISSLAAAFLPAPVLFKLIFLMMLLLCMGVCFYGTNWRVMILYAVITVEIMQLCYGISNSVSGIVYPYLYSHFYQLYPDTIGVYLMIVSGLFTFTAAFFCYYLIYRYFTYTDTERNQPILIILTPLLMIFLISEYIGHTVYGNTVVLDSSGRMLYINNLQMLVLQIFSILSLFCILYAYKRTIDSFRVSEKLRSLEHERRYQNQYISEAKTRYDRTQSFRHDVKNHLSVVHGCLEKGNVTEAKKYLEDMEMLTNQLSFPCCTGNPVLDILIGNKLGIAKNYGIAVSCFLKLPCPCLIPDIDFCIILSNALDNAIHGCETAAGDEETYIRISGRRQGNILLLEIENSYHGQPDIKPGTGLSNIKSVCEKYNGAMNITCQSGGLCLNVMLIIPQHAEHISHQTD